MYNLIMHLTVISWIKSSLRNSPCWISTSTRPKKNKKKQPRIRRQPSKLALPYISSVHENNQLTGERELKTVSEMFLGGSFIDFLGKKVYSGEI